MVVRGASYLGNHLVSKVKSYSPSDFSQNLCCSFPITFPFVVKGKGTLSLFQKAVVGPVCVCMHVCSVHVCSAVCICFEKHRVKVVSLLSHSTEAATAALQPIQQNLSFAYAWHAKCMTPHCVNHLSA